MRQQVASMAPKIAGIANAFELVLRFAAWAGQLRGDPSVEQIRDQFNVSRATAYRWRAAWLAARGTHNKERTT